jgi:hypothetical protein
MDVLIAAGSYKESQIGGKFDMRAHSTKPSYVRQDTTRFSPRLCALLRSMPIAALHKDQKIFTAETRRRRENLLFSAAQTALTARLWFPSIQP